MKKNVLKIFILGFVLMTTSSFDSNSFKPNDIDLNMVNQYKVNQLFEIKNLAETKIAYNLLNVEEKFFIWNNKLETLISKSELYGNKVTLTSDQKKLLIEIHSILDLNLFTDNIKNDKKEYIKYLYMPDFIKRASKHFNKLDLVSIFNDVRASNYTGFKGKSNLTLAALITMQNDNPEDGGGGGGGGECTCNVGSAFSCILGTEDCLATTPSCTPESSGCGGLWLNDCDGKCFT